MNLDEKVKRTLESEADEIDKILIDDEGIFDLVKGSFKGGLGRWMVLVNVVTLLVSFVMVWVGYRFFVSSELIDYVFWGVCVILAANAQIAMKQWIWAEMQRSSLLREVKRVELSVARLTAQLNGK